MAKIGVLTFHRSNNTGAYIQCYALVKQLKEDFPEHEIEVIDYCTKNVLLNYTWHLKEYLFLSEMCDTHNIKEYILRVLKRAARLIMNPQLLKDRKYEQTVFEKCREHLPLSSERMVSNDICDFEKFAGGKYDVVIVGSDCVWQYINYPFPNAYLLSGEIAKVKMSYAACAYKMKINEMRDGDINEMKNALSSFQYLGVRDIETERLLDKLSLSGKHNCDPSFLLNIEEIPVDMENLRSKLVKAGVDFNRKVIGLQVSNRHVGKWIKNIFNSDEYQIVSIRIRNPYAEKFLDFLSPFEWSRVFAFFSFTVTDFFHGTLLSLINGTYPLAFDSGFYDDGMISRLNDVMQRLDLMDYYYKIKKDEPVPNRWINETVMRIEKTDNKKEKLEQILKREREYYNEFQNELKTYIH